MAKVGLSKPYIAKYSNVGSTVAYETATLMGKAVSLTLSLNGGDSNVLYADNAPAESNTQFNGGTLTLTTDDLLPEPLIKLLGVKKETMNVTGVSAEDAAWMVYDDDQIVPYVGVAGIIKKIVSGVTKYVAVVYPKVQFQNINDSVNTQGETIEWQTNEISATLMRSDNAKHEWKRISTELATEAEAEAAIKDFFNPTE